MCGGSCAARRQTSGCLLIRPAGREPLTGSPPGYPVAPSPCAPTLILWRVQWGHLSLEVVIYPVRVRLDKGYSVLQWGHLSLEVVMTPRRSTSVSGLGSFNGATSL